MKADYRHHGGATGEERNSRNVLLPRHRQLERDVSRIAKVSDLGEHSEVRCILAISTESRLQMGQIDMRGRQDEDAVLVDLLPLRNDALYNIGDSGT